MFTYCNFLSGRAEMIQVRKVCDESDDGWEGRGRQEGGEGCRGGGWGCGGWGRYLQHKGIRRSCVINLSTLLYLVVRQ